MSLAGLSLETATRRGGFDEGEETAEAMLVWMDVRLAASVEAREGEMGIFMALKEGLWVSDVLVIVIWAGQNVGRC